MKKPGIFTKFGLQSGVVTIAIVVSNLGCTNSSRPQTIQTLPNQIPNHTSTVDTLVAQESTQQPSPTLAIQSTSILQPSNVVTVLPTDTLDSTILPLEIVQEMLGQIDKEEALSTLRQLSGEEPICIDNDCYTIKNRLTGGEGLRWAKDYLYKELTSLGYEVEYQNWSSSGYTDQNLIARKSGLLHPDEEVYFVAHIDGTKKIWANRFPAADDNGSGTVDLLEAARILSKYSFDRTLVFFFSTGEEEGRLGVNSYLGGLSEKELNSIIYVINVDMVGYDENLDRAMELWYGDDPSSYALTQKMNKIILAYQVDLLPKFIVGCG